MSGIISARLGGICAVLFVVFLFVGATLGLDSPDNDAPDQEWIDYVNDDSKLVMNIVGGYLMVIAGILFLVFLVAMYRRLRSAEDADTGLPLIMLISGTAWAIALMIGAIIIQTVPGGIKLGTATPASAETARWMPQAGFAVMLVVGGLCAALMSAVMSVLIIRTKALPAWLAYLGFVAALAMLAAAIFLPVILFVLWVLVLGIVMTVAGEPAREAAPA